MSAQATPQKQASNISPELFANLLGHVKEIEGLKRPDRLATNLRKGATMSAQATLQKQASKISPELFAPYIEAATLLDDNNLIWDKDFDLIRLPLARSLRECAATHNLNPWFLEVAYRLIDTTRTNA